ncbi:MAG: 1,2-phenylacetyl-CoA epoxidase subunit PaaD [Ferruginibacter sp.]
MQKQTLDIKQEEKKIRDILSNIIDPEIPVLTLQDMGIIRQVSVTDNAVSVTITPTYSGCPAMDMITMQIKMELLAAGYENIEVVSVLSPAWTTDWMSEAGKQKLRSYGIAPPNTRQQVCSNDLFAPNEAVQCPQCNSYNTILKSEFGSTACKSLYQCNECKEPFDYFKCH